MDDPRATSAARFLPSSSAVAAAVGPGPLLHVVETGSTNRDLVDEARAGVVDPVVLVADHQTAGRGRLDRRWEAEPGAGLLMSVRVPIAQQQANSVVQGVGAAARAAADSICRVPVLAKWPNDLVVTDGAAPGKLAGVLGEFVDGPTTCVVVGIGINISPVPGQSGATSIEQCGGAADRDRLLAALLEELASRLDDPSRLVEEQRIHSATLGTRVRAELPGGRVLSGTASDLDDAGSLLLVDDDGATHVVTTGDVIHLRPA
ncbi:MAG: biotin--[acetyl-CoA-carboxylase] ligase [Actinomycetota bacterium]